MAGWRGGRSAREGRSTCARRDSEANSLVKDDERRFPDGKSVYVFFLFFIEESDLMSLLELFFENIYIMCKLDTVCKFGNFQSRPRDVHPWVGVGVCDCFLKFLCSSTI